MNTFIRSRHESAFLSVIYVCGRLLSRFDASYALHDVQYAPRMNVDKLLHRSYVSFFIAKEWKSKSIVYCKFLIEKKGKILKKNKFFIKIKSSVDLGKSAKTVENVQKMR